MTAPKFQRPPDRPREWSVEELNDLETRVSKVEQFCEQVNDWMHDPDNDSGTSPEEEEIRGFFLDMARSHVKDHLKGSS